MRLLVPLVALAFVAGCLGAQTEPEAPREDRETDAASTRPITDSFSGTATGTPATPDEQDFTLEVPRGAVGVNGTLSWARPPVGAPLGLTKGLDLQLLDPDGEIVSEGYEDVNGDLIVVTIEPPRAGTWTFRVIATQALNTAFTLDVAAELIVPENNVVAKTLTLNQASFYEVNLILEKDASFVFSFNASAPVEWDVHSHPPEGLKEWHAGEGTSGGIAFTGPHRDVYSILWSNPNPLPTELSFEITGTFRLHSHSG